MKLEGKLIVINPTVEVGVKKFPKRTVVIETFDKYPQTIEVEFVGDNTDHPDRFNVGQVVAISVDIRGRAWTNPEGQTRYFNTIQGWRIEAIDQRETNPIGAPKEAAQPLQPQADDLPF